MEKTDERTEWMAKLPDLKQKRDDEKLNWGPMEVRCEEAVEQYLLSLRSAMKTCVPDYYDSSCEKECIEIQETRPGGEGCGVVEGNMPNDITGRGGPAVNCVPPAMSFVKSAYTYGPDPPTESALQQCGRIFSKQQPLYAQKILKHGYLMKRGRNWKWRKHYFVLESGDHMRTGVLRYWQGDVDPSGDRGAVEQFHKSTLLWDAERVISQEGSHYRWKDGSACFSIVHFYRWIRLCVPGVYEDSEKASLERDDWVKKVESQLEENRKLPDHGYR